MQKRMQNALNNACLCLFRKRLSLKKSLSHTLTHYYTLLNSLKRRKKEMEDGNGKRKGCDEVVGDVAGKKPRTPENGDVTGKNQEAEAEQEQEDADMMAWLTLDEETAAELSKLLDSDEAPPPPFKVRFMKDPYTSPVVFQSSSAYVTINGNEESCGSSFSESESSLMASVDMGDMKRKVFGAVSGWFNGESGGSWGLQAGEERGLGEECSGVDGILVGEMDGCDLFDCFHNPSVVDNDDDMWVKFLGEDLFGLQ